MFVPKTGEGELPLWVELGPLVVTILGFAVAYYYYILHPEEPRKLAARRGMLYLFLYNKWYFDELYDFLFVQPAKKLGRFLWKVGDGQIIDVLRVLFGNVDANFSHHFDGKRIHAVRLDAGGIGFDLIRFEMTGESFGHLAAAGVAGAEQENASCHRLAFLRPRLRWAA